MLNNPKVLVHLPSRSRPQKLFACLDNIFQMSITPELEILVTLDVDDPTVANNEVRDKLAMYNRVTAFYGTSGTKVISFNRDISLINDWDILVSSSDDILFVSPGFDKIIINRMTEDFPDGDGVLHFNDGNHYGDKLMTATVMGRKYYDRFGYVYHPSYASVYCDNESAQVSKQLGKYKYYPEILFNHLHPAWSKGEWDELYARNEEPVQYQKDAENYRQREAINFGL